MAFALTAGVPDSVVVAHVAAAQNLGATGPLTVSGQVVAGMRTPDLGAYRWSPTGERVDVIGTHTVATMFFERGGRVIGASVVSGGPIREPGPVVATPAGVRIHRDQPCRAHRPVVAPRWPHGRDVIGRCPAALAGGPRARPQFLDGNRVRRMIPRDRPSGGSLPVRRPLIAAFITAAALLWLAATATATTGVVSATPSPGARVGSVAGLRMEFAVPVESRFAVLELWAHGRLASLPAHVDTGDPQVVVAPWSERTRPGRGMGPFSCPDR